MARTTRGDENRHALRSAPITLAIGVVFAAGLSPACGSNGPSQPDPTFGPPGQGSVRIPRQSDWTERGVVLSAGPAGSWEVRLHGMISPAGVVKKGGVYFLYYLGADGDRSTDGGPRHRALGVATSADGISFTKFAGNPILTFLPHGNEEEGIFSAAVSLDGGGGIVLYYGAMDAGDATSELVDSDVRLATSTDGLAFLDVGDVISHADASVWGFGDELFPVGVFRADALWSLYYIAKGRRGVLWDLGIAQGASPSVLPSTSSVLTSGSFIIGGGDVVEIAPDRIAVFLVRDSGIMEVRTAMVDAPHVLSEPVEVYGFEGARHATIFLDRQSGTWYMYYRKAKGDTIFLRTAPMTLVGTSLSNLEPGRIP